MQSYFGTLSENNGNLDLLDESQDIPTGEDISNFTEIDLQASSGHHHSLDQTEITLHQQSQLFADDEDLFFCGRCKQQYTDLQLFIQHKRDGCVSVRQQSLQYQNEALLHHLQQQATGQLQQNERGSSLPGDTVLFTSNQDLVNQGQPAALMISTSQHLHESAGLNLTQDAGKNQLSQPMMRNTISNINLLSCDPAQTPQITINQVGNLIQIQGSQFQNVANAIMPREIVAEGQDHNPPQNLVLSEEMLLGAGRANNSFPDTQLGRMQQNEVNPDEYGQVTSGIMGNCGNGNVTSFLQQTLPLDHAQNNQVLIQMQQPASTQNIPQKDLLNGLNLSAVSLTPFSVSTSSTNFLLQDDSTESVVAQNLSKFPTIAPRPKSSVPSEKANPDMEELETKPAQPVVLSEDTEPSTEKTKRKFVCKFCSQTFTRAFDMEQHVRSHTGEKPFQCIVCGRAFAQKSNVKKHMATHKVWPKKFLDDMPNIVIVQDTKDKNMEQETAQSTEDPDAATSDKGVVGMPTYKDALAMMTKSIHTCPYCYKMLSSYKERKLHMNEHKDQQVYKCVKENCEETFPDLDSFIEHVKSHDGELTYRCHHCYEVFDSLHDLGIHQYKAHLNTRPKSKKDQQLYACTICPSKFQHPDLLQKHMASESHNHECPKCPKRFSCERYLTKHLMLMHSDKPKAVVKCEVCGATMRSEYYLRSHMLIHTKEKPFKCEICPSAFNRKDKLKRHMLLHDPVKKWKCPLRDVLGCDKEFNRPDKLKAHIIRHGGVNRHKCSYCPKTYSRRCFRIAHERTHTDEFRCKDCAKGFESAAKLSSHRCKPSGFTTGSLKKHLSVASSPKGDPTELTAPNRALISRSGGLPSNITLSEGPTMYAIRSGNTPKRSDRGRSAAKGASRKKKAVGAKRKENNARLKAAKSSPASRVVGKINVEIEVNEGQVSGLNNGENVTITFDDDDVDVEIEDEGSTT